MVIKRRFRGIALPFMLYLVSGVAAVFFINEAGNELNVLDHLTGTPANIHEIAERTGIKVTEVDVPLCKLVSLGYAKRTTGEGNRNLYSK
jgi:predicted Rossmann fold nucleotide-binding protein DprA/Smf involved in DNA uptake